MDQNFYETFFDGLNRMKLLQRSITETLKDVIVKCDVVHNLFNYYSDLIKLLREVAWLLRYNDYSRKRFLNHDVECKTGESSQSQK